MLLSFALAMSATLHCRVEDAHYALRGEPTVTAYFKRVDSGPDWPSGLALAIHFRKTGRTYWWLPWDGGTDDLQNVASTTDVLAPGWQRPSPDGGRRPHGNMEYVATDARYNIIEATPRRNGAAPAHILLSGLGDGVRHAGLEPRDSAVKQFFDLVACRLSGRPGK